MTDWPNLEHENWQATYHTLHMWTQVVGKVALALTPRSNHWWNIAFHPSACGMATPVMKRGDRAFSIAFNFVDHRLEIRCSDGGFRQIALEPMSVAEFYRFFRASLREMGLGVKMWPMPVEVENPIRFADDHIHASYDREWVAAWWRATLSMTAVMSEFRCGFVGKCSPVHFFWGAFDLAVTRFSGHRAPPRPGKGFVDQEAYSHEVISHGFWPGSGPVTEPSFYAYAVPPPLGFVEALVQPEEAYYHPGFGEFILPYSAVASSKNPAAALAAFLQSTYEAGAKAPNWDHVALERPMA